MTDARVRRRRPEACITAEKAGVWVYGNREAFGRLAKEMALLARSSPIEHEQLLVKWHLGGSAKKDPAVFVLMDKESQAVHKGQDFDLTFMVVEPSDLKRLRQHQKSGRLPRGWEREK